MELFVPIILIFNFKLYFYSKFLVNCGIKNNFEKKKKKKWKQILSTLNILRQDMQ